MADGDGRSPRSILGYFGLETGQKAWDVLVWTSPYLLFLIAGLVGMSFAVQWVFPLPLLLHTGAICLAVLYFFLFLARVRHVAETGGGPENAEAGGDAGPTDQP
jgi:hypothetical protein